MTQILPKMYEIQRAVRDALAGDATFQTLSRNAFGKEMTVFMDKNEIVAVEDLPQAIVHKNFVSDDAGIVLAALQINLIAMLDKYDDQVREYGTIIALEDLGIRAVEVVDSVVCNYGLTRETYNAFVSSIGEAEDVEWIVSIGLASMSKTKFI